MREAERVCIADFECVGGYSSPDSLPHTRNGEIEAFTFPAHRILMKNANFPGSETLV